METKPIKGARDVVSLAVPLRAHGEPALAAALISIVEAGIRSRMAEQSDDEDKIASARDLAFLLAAIGRRAEAEELAKNTSLAAEAQLAARGYNVATQFAIAGVIFEELGEKSSALKELVKAVQTFPSYYPLEKRIKLFKPVIDALIAVDPTEAKAAIDACIVDNARLDSAHVRAENLAALTPLLMAVRDPYRARIVAERAGSAAYVLAGYKSFSAA